MPHKRVRKLQYGTSDFDSFTLPRSTDAKMVIDAKYESQRNGYEQDIPNLLWKVVSIDDVENIEEIKFDDAARPRRAKVVKAPSRESPRNRSFNRCRRGLQSRCSHVTQ